MKKVYKFVVVLLVALLLIGCSALAGVDWASMTDDELIKELAKGEAELDNRMSGTFVQQDLAKAQDLNIVLNWNEAGEYGQEITLNEGTDSAYTYYRFFVPVGKYIVTNNGEYGSQVTFYKNETYIEDGWEYAESDSNHRPVMLMPGDSAEIEVFEGEYIKLADHDSNIELTSVQ